jgi:hypothetical protein
MLRSARLGHVGFGTALSSLMIASVVWLAWVSTQVHG